MSMEQGDSPSSASSSVAKSLKVEIIESERGNCMLFAEGNKFSRQKILSSGEQRWRCYVKTCKAHIKTLGHPPVPSNWSLDHSHSPPTAGLIERQKMSTSAKRKAVEQISERPSIILKSLINESNVNVLQTSDIVASYNNLYYARRKLLPGLLPRSNDDVHDTAASTSVDSKISEQEAHMSVHMEGEPLIIAPSGAGNECIVIKQEPYIGEEVTTEPWAAYNPVENPVKCETTDPILGDPVPMDLEKDDLLYFKSLVPDLIKLTPELKDVFRMKVRNILKELTA